MKSNLETIVGVGVASFLAGVAIDFIGVEPPHPILFGVGLTGVSYAVDRIKNKAMPLQYYASYALGALFGFSLAYKLFTQ